MCMVNTIPWLLGRPQARSARVRKISATPGTGSPDCPSHWMLLYWLWYPNCKCVFRANNYYLVRFIIFRTYSGNTRGQRRINTVNQRTSLWLMYKLNYLAIKRVWLRYISEIPCSSMCLRKYTEQLTRSE